MMNPLGAYKNEEVQMCSLYHNSLKAFKIGIRERVFVAELIKASILNLSFLFLYSNIRCCLGDHVQHPIENLNQ